MRLIEALAFRIPRKDAKGSAKAQRIFILTQGIAGEEFVNQVLTSHGKSAGSCPN